MYNFTAVIFTSFLICSAPVLASSAPPVAPDNSKMNQRDTNSDELTAAQQGNTQSDVEISRKLRKELVKDKRLSVYAHNVKIITQDGVITLKGPVRTEAEKALIEARAGKIVGCRHVENEMDVSPKL